MTNYVCMCIFSDDIHMFHLNLRNSYVECMSRAIKDGLLKCSFKFSSSHHKKIKNLVKTAQIFHLTPLAFSEFVG